LIGISQIPVKSIKENLAYDSLHLNFKYGQVNRVGLNFRSKFLDKVLE